MPSPSRSWVFAWSVRVAAAVIVFLRAFFPPWRAATGLDPSWQAGLTEASTRGLQFGRDIVFTFGPLGFLGIGASTPSTYWQMLAFAIAVAALLAGLTVYETLGPGTIFQKVAFVAVVFLCLNDVTNIEQLAWIFILAWTLREFRDERAAPLMAFLLGMLSGIVLLVKFNVGVSVCLGGFALFALRLILRARRGPVGDLKALLTFSLGVVLGSAVFFAPIDYGPVVATILAVGVFAVGILIPSASGSRAKIIAGLGVAGSLALVLASAYRAFVGNSLQIALGYSSAMSIAGARWELPFALAILLVVFLLLYANMKTLTLPVSAALSIALFFAYKEGFVRQDAHVLSAFYAPLFVTGVILRASANRRLLIVNAVGAFVAFFALSTVIKAESSSSGFASTFNPARTVADISRFQTSFPSSQAIEAGYGSGLAPDLFSPALVKRIGRSTVDVEPVEAAAVLANGFFWNPEPIFQEYSAYTPKLDMLNAEHVYSSGAQNILFEWAAIDGQQPVWDQPAATRAFLCRYALVGGFAQPVFTANKTEFLLLKRVPQRCAEARFATGGTYAWNEKIPVPRSSDLTFMLLRIRYSPLGRIVKPLFRIPPVTARVSDSQGRVSEYRILTETSGDGILVGPFPQDLTQLRAVLENRKNVPRAVSLELETDAPDLFDSKIQSDFEFVEYR